MKNYETELPAEYKEAMVIDAKNTKFAVIMNIAAFAVMIAIIVPAYFIISPKNYFEEYSFLRNIIFIVAMFAYIVLHELCHGAAYKVLTKRKLSFGMTLTVAYCGVPDIYVYRKAALISLLAPFVVFTVIFGALMLFLPNDWDKLYSAFLLAMHIGGCAGDLYDTAVYLFKFRDPQTLMQDTGPKQTFYIKD